MLTAQGYKAIEAVVLGELLWSKNTDTGEQAWKPVTRIFREPNQGIYDLVLKSEQGDVQYIETTDDHPFYAAVIDQHRVDLTYNFTIADFHTYYVTKRRVLVHNCPNGGGVTKTADAPFTKVKFEKGMTRKSPPQIKTDISADQAIKNLEANGFTKKSFKAQNGGTGHVLSNGQGKVYQSYPNATSGAGDSLQAINNGKTTSKIRLGNTDL